MFTDILRRDRDSVSAMLGKAVALSLQGRMDAANAQLEIIARMPPDAEFAREREQALLMRASFLLEKGRESDAVKLCRECIDANKACAKAWEILGQIAEDKLQYTKAAEHLKKAWTCVTPHSTAVGARLAYNLLKSRSYVRAISVCHQVLEIEPDHPRIRTTVMDRARRALRP